MFSAPVLPTAAQELNVCELGWRRFFLRTQIYMKYGTLKAMVGQFEEVACERRLALCLHPSACLRTHANKYAHQVICDRKKGGCGAVVSYTSLGEPRQKRGTRRSEASLLDAAVRQGAEEVETRVIPSCPRCDRPQRIWNPAPGIRMPRWRCETWLVCKVLGEVLPGTPSNVRWPGGLQPRHPQPVRTTAESASSHAAPQIVTPEEVAMVRSAMSDMQRLQAAMIRSGILNPDAAPSADDPWVDVPMTPVAAMERFLAQTQQQTEGCFPDAGV